MGIDISKIKKSEVLTFIIILLLVLLVFYLIRLKDLKSDMSDQVNLYNSLTDSLLVYKTKDGLNKSTISMIETNLAKTFLQINTKDKEIKELQELVKSQGKDIDKLRTALIAKTQVIYIDTGRIYTPIGGDTILFSKSVLLDTISTPWISSTYGFRYGKSYFDLNVKDELDIVLKENRGIFNVEVTNKNPYSTTYGLRAYQVQGPKPKRWGLGIEGGFGGFYDIHRKQVGLGPYVGFGFSYDILNW